MRVHIKFEKKHFESAKSASKFSKKKQHSEYDFNAKTRTFPLDENDIEFNTISLSPFPKLL